MKQKRPRGVGLVLAAVVLASSFVGCPLLKKKAAAETDDDEQAAAAAAAVADADTVTAAGLGAKNEASVLRYANETALENEPAVIGTDGTKARNFPGNGPEVATLAKGTPVAKVAQYFNTATLVMFDDPSGDGSKLIGWVSPKAFDVAAPAPTKTVVVPPRVDAGTSPSPAKDAGATAKDAGASPTPVKDAGASPTPAKDAGAAPVDAGSKTALPQPPKSAVAVSIVDGKCPDGWAIAENMCRRKCAADADCPRNTKCATKSGNKVCTSDH